MVGVEHRRVDRLLQVQAEAARGRGRTAATTGPAGRRRACRTPARSRRRGAPCDGDSVVRGRAPPARATRGRPSSSQNICARVPRQKPSPAIAGEHCSQPPLGVAETRLPKRSATSRWQVSPRVGSPAPADDRAAARGPRQRGRRAAGPQLARGFARRSARGAACAYSAREQQRRAAPAPSRRTTPPGRRTRASRPRSRVCTCSMPGTGRAQSGEQRELLQEHRPLAPRPGLEHRPVRGTAGTPAPRSWPRYERQVAPRRRGTPAGVDRLRDPAAVPGVARGVDPRLPRARRDDRRRAARRCRPASGCAARPSDRLPQRGRTTVPRRVDPRDRAARSRAGRETVPRLADRGLEHVRELRACRGRAAAAATRRTRPARTRPRAGARARASRPSVPEARDRRRRRRRALSAEHAHARPVPEQQRQIAARAVEVRLDDLQREPRRHRGVERVAAALEHGHPGGRRQPVRRGHHAEGARKLRPRRECHSARNASLPARMTLIDGKAIAQEVRNEIRDEVAEWVAAGTRPRAWRRSWSATILPPRVYVGGKQKACAEVGHARLRPPPVGGRERGRGARAAAPAQRDRERERHPAAAPAAAAHRRSEAERGRSRPARTSTASRRSRPACCRACPGLRPCTPLRLHGAAQGATTSTWRARRRSWSAAATSSASRLALLLQANATVTIAHSRTKDLAEVCRRADILVAAVGRAAR